MIPPALPALPDDVVRALPSATPAPPWVCRVDAVVWWHRATREARAALAPGLRPGLPLTVGAVLRYRDSPVGPYQEVLGAPLLLRGGGLVRGTVPFIAVDSLPSLAGGRVHWDLPKVLARFTRDGSAVRAAGDGWHVEVVGVPRGPSLPVAARLSSTQDGVRRARSRVRGSARAARVEVDGAGLPGWLRPGRHRGAVLTGARLVVGPPR